MLERTQVREIFAEAIALSGEARAAYLDRACGANQELRDEVESLLTAATRNPAFMGAPTISASPGHEADASGSRIGPYLIRKLIGQGGFGLVYAAEQQSPVQRKVALKIIKLGMDTQAVIARFESERQTLAMMVHPNIASVIDAGVTESGRPYFVMEYVEGQSITKYADQMKLSIAARLQLFVEVCDAVQHAHAKGIIHRDIKPGNVLVTMRDGQPHVKVIDFGIAKAVQHHELERTQLTLAGQFVGTPEYMSPEQAGGERDVDTRSDVYSLGVLLYELLTGDTPFASSELRSAAFAEVQRIIREVDPPKPSTKIERLRDAKTQEAMRESHNWQLAGDLDWIAMKAISKDRTRRYDTPSQLASDVQRHLAGEPVSAAPPSTWYRISKFVRRNRLLVGSIAAIVAVLAAGVVGTSIGLVEASRANKVALVNAQRATNEAEQANAINEFMREVLTSVEPENAGANVRLKDVLASASASAPQRFAGYPLLEAQVHEMLEAVYAKLAMHSQAKAEAETAVTLFRAHAGENDPRTLWVESRVLRALINLNKTKDADAFVKDLLPRAQHSLGNDHATTIQVRRSLGTVLMMQGRLDDAESVFTELRTNPSVATDDTVQARVLYSLYRIHQQRPIPQDAKQRAAYWDDAEQLTRDCVACSLRAFGPRSADLVRAQQALAQTLCDRGNACEAAEMCRSILAGTASRLDPCHEFRRQVATTLADALAALGECDEPADLTSQSIACVRVTKAQNPVAYVSALGDGLKYIERAGRAAEGESLAREGLAALSSFKGPTERFVYIFELYIANFTSMRGRLEEAHGLFQPLLEREHLLGDSQTRARTHLFYALHLARLGEFELAEESLRRAAIIRADSAAGSRDRSNDEIAVGFIALYKAWGKPDKAREYEMQREQLTGISSRH